MGTPRAITNSLFTLYPFLFHIHTCLVWKGKQKKLASFGRAAEVSFGEQSLLIAWASPQVPQSVLGLALHCTNYLQGQAVVFLQRNPAQPV